ncbi:MAG: arylsulfatase [Isosphaera sp.]|nr:arylsulfatase [Isosphaera sp.]
MKPLLTTLACGLVVFGGVAGAADPKPNIVLIMADDFGYECVSANGGESYKTPNLDKLAATGTRFEHCHVQPLCTPTRVQLMTGKYNVRNYVNFGTLPRSEVTFAHLLGKAGYATAVCGKWQLGREVDSPKHFGFGESYLWQHTRRPPRYANPGLEHDGKELDFTNGEYGPKLLNDFALDFVGRNKDKPFFLYYPLTLTHGPFQPTPDSPAWDPKAKGEAVNNDPKHFADMVAYMDKMVGRLVARLDELKVRDNTLILFVGDNGTGRGITSKLKGEAYPGGKGSTTARGTHVPLIANWPARAKQPGVCRDLVSSVDFLTTLCEAAGVPAPAGTDGRSFLPQVCGEKGTPREFLYCWYSPRQGADLTVREYAADHGHKLYRTGEFYDLAADPFEARPLKAADQKGPAADAAAKLQKVLDGFKDARPAALDKVPPKKKDKKD